MGSLINKRSDCVYELTITVRGDGNKDFPIVWNWEWLSWLVYDLVEVDSQGVVVPTE